MAKSRFLIVQFLVEADLGEDFEVDSFAGIEEVSSAFKLTKGFRNHELKIYELARRPEPRVDVTIECYEYNGFLIEILQNATTVGSQRPTYFAVATNPNTKSPQGSVVEPSDLEKVAEARALAEQYVDKRKSQIERRAERKREL